jgi:hypothetical protein
MMTPFYGSHTETLSAIHPQTSVCLPACGEVGVHLSLSVFTTALQMPPRELTVRDVRYRVHSVDHMEHLPQADVARDMLQRAVDVINVLLKRRSWTIIRVSEFFPRNASLLGLNVNRGEHVKIRLRRSVDASRLKRPRAPRAARGGRGGRGGRGRGAGGGVGMLVGSTGSNTMTIPNSTSGPVAPPASHVQPVARGDFFGWEEIMCTLIHETVHVTISPHDAQFWKLYHELVAECEGIISGGNAAGSAAAAPGAKPTKDTAPFVPFRGAGRSLGGMTGRTGDVSADERRRLCALAASRRLEAAAALLATRECCGTAGRQEASRGTPRHSQDPAGTKALPTLDHLPESDDLQWSCEICGGSNSILLPYCEYCCGDAAAADDGVLELTTGSDLDEVQEDEPPAQRGPRAEVARPVNGSKPEVIDLLSSDDDIS